MTSRIRLVAALACLSLGVAALTGCTPQGPNQSPGASSTELTVTGEPPQAGGSWRQGARTAWRIDPVEETGGDMDPFSFNVTQWGLWAFVGDLTRAFYGLDLESGDVTWGPSVFMDCTTNAVDGVAACLQDDGSEGSSIQLIDVRSGEVSKTATLASLGVDAEMDWFSRVEFVDGDVVVTVPSYPDRVLPDSVGDLAEVTAFRVRADLSEAVWSTTLPGCDRSACKNLPAHGAPDALLSRGVVALDYGLVLDFATGKSILPDKAAGAPVAVDAVYTTTPDNDVSTGEVQAPDGKPIALTSAGGGVQVMSGLPPHPVDVVQVGDGRALSMIDETTGDPIWGSDTPLATGDDPRVAVAYNQGVFVVQSAPGAVQRINPATGELLWTSEDANDYWAGPSWTNDGLLLVTDDQDTRALDPDTGQELFRVSGMAEAVPDAIGQSLLVTDVQVPGEHVTRLVPADRATDVEGVPAEAPACPEGMEPVTWTQYADGAVLVCEGGDAYAVITPSQPDWQATNLDFIVDGYFVTFADGTVLRVGLGGSIVYLQSGGSTTSHVATSAWSRATGLVEYRPPADLPTCATGSWPLSVSTFSGGWLLVCGTSPTQPTAMTYVEDGQSEDLDDVAWKDEGYCGTSGGTETCVYGSPIAIGRTNADGTTWYQVSANYTAERGASGGDATMDEKSALARLESLAKQDGDRVSRDGQWVAQLASKFLGVTDPLQVTADGSHTFDASDILNEHLNLRFGVDAPEVVLLDSRTYGKRSDHDGEAIWVTMALDPSFQSEDDVLAWCEQLYPYLSGDERTNSCMPNRLRS